MKILIKIKDAHKKRVLDAFDEAYGGRVAAAGEGKKPVSKAEWVKLQVVKFVKQTVEGHEAAKARAVAEEKVVVKELGIE